MSRTDKDRPFRLALRDRPHRGWPSPLPPAPAWYVNHTWNAPDRLRARVACQTAIAEHRATGETHTVVPVDQHRQGAKMHWT